MSRITAAHLRDASERIRREYPTLTRTAYARLHRLPARTLADYLNIDGSPKAPRGRLAAKRLQAACRPPAVARAAAVPWGSAVDTAAASLARQGSWGFPANDDTFVDVLDGCCEYYGLRIDLDRGRGHETFGRDAVHPAGVIRVRDGRYSVLLRHDGTEYEVPQDDDRGFHALNALRLGMQGALLEHYRVRGPRGDIPHSLIQRTRTQPMPSIQIMRQVAANISRQAAQPPHHQANT